MSWKSFPDEKCPEQNKKISNRMILAKSLPENAWACARKIKKLKPESKSCADSRINGFRPLKQAFFAATKPDAVISDF
ncbi:hypothetical protein EDS67_26455 [candidate division KSB1 bacterium]|nr:MAG: hypothetical protein EDS67_26455 [candidate division KSB1 bacterium]MCE7943599.1 hypothetical protein [Chlorobi bacterium CHB1]MDL1874549.1 hypothetical protein [Cytophagia bacterium CHB2]